MFADEVREAMDARIQPWETTFAEIQRRDKVIHQAVVELLPVCYFKNAREASKICSLLQPPISFEHDLMALHLMFRRKPNVR